MKTQIQDSANKQIMTTSILVKSKKAIFILAIAVGTMAISCKSNTEKAADATEDVVEANDNLNSVNEEVKTDAITKANDEEWQTYKTEANKTITQNEIRIMELQKAMKKPGKSFDENYKKSIESLSEKNEALRTKINDYENNQTDWDTFKREYDSDMEGLSQAFKDLSVNNKK